MNILVSKHPNTLIDRFGYSVFTEQLGILVSPRMIPSRDWLRNASVTWAADNDCFQGLDRAAYLAMLKELARYAGQCRFVAAPDVVGDATATLLRFKLWLPTLKYYGLPVALVAQDGLERLPIPWDDFDALFIGGSTEWKLSIHAARLAIEAKRRGKWLHVGRVNSNIRLNHSEDFLVADSVDGTGYAKFSDAMLPRALRKLEQPRLVTGMDYAD